MRKLKFLYTIILACTLISCNQSNKKEKDTPGSDNVAIIDDSISRKAGVNSIVPGDTIKRYSEIFSHYNGRYQLNSLQESKTAIFEFAGKNKIKVQLFSGTSYLNSISDEGEITMTNANRGYFNEPKQFRLDFIFSDSAVIINEKRDSTYLKHADLSFTGVYLKMIGIAAH